MTLFQIRALRRLKHAACHATARAAGDGLRGFLLTGLIALPITWVFMSVVFGYLDDRLAAKIVDDARQRAGQQHRLPGEKHVVVERAKGVPYLIYRPLVGAVSEPSWRLRGTITEATSISMIKIFKTPADKDIYEKRVEEQAAEQGKVANPHFRRPDGPLYGIDALLIEIVLVKTSAGERQLVLDVGIQTAPDQYSRLPWWSSEGASNSNSLLSISRHSWIGHVRQVDCPTTVDSFTTWLERSFLVIAKGVNPDYGVVGALKLAGKEFSRQVVHPLEELITEDVGGLSTRTEVLQIALIGGILQWLMSLTMVMTLLSAGARATLSLVVDRRYLRLLQEAPPARRGSVLNHLRRRHERLFGLPSVVLESAMVGGFGKQLNPKDVQAASDQLADRRAKQNRVLAENAAHLNFYGMLGSLIYIATSLSALRLHPNPAVTGATLSTMAVSLGQAFWTTACSATLCRIVMWMVVFQGAAEDSLLREWNNWIATLGRRPNPRRTVRPLPARSTTVPAVTDVPPPAAPPTPMPQPLVNEGRPAVRRVLPRLWSKLMGLLLLLAILGVCASEALGGDPLVLTRRGPQSASRSSIVFCARDGVPGHAFVVLGEESEERRQSTIEAFGFYPRKGLGVFGPVPGHLADEVLEKRSLASGDCLVIVHVERDIFQKVDEIRSRWSETKEYRLVQSDCVSFVDEVARATGLKTARTAGGVDSRVVHQVTGTAESPHGSLAVQFIVGRCSKSVSGRGFAAALYVFLRTARAIFTLFLRGQF